MYYKDGYIGKTKNGKFKVKMIDEPKDKEGKLKRDVFSKEFLEWYVF